MLVSRNWAPYPRPAPPGMDEHFAIAVEHVAWCIGAGWSPAEVFVALGVRSARSLPSWNDAIWAVARASEDLGHPQLRRAA